MAVASQAASSSAAAVRRVGRVAGADGMGSTVAVVIRARLSFVRHGSLVPTGTSSTAGPTSAARPVGVARRTICSPVSDARQIGWSPVAAISSSRPAFNIDCTTVRRAATGSLTGGQVNCPLSRAAASSMARAVLDRFDVTYQVQDETGNRRRSRRFDRPREIIGPGAPPVRRAIRMAHGGGFA